MSEAIRQRSSICEMLKGAVKGEGIMKVFDFEQHKAEAKEKWGQTPAYKEYEAKTSGYSEIKHNALAAGMDRIMAEFASCMKNGKAPDAAEAQALAKTLQDYITENYYLCTNEILAGLGQMYVNDERFKNNIDNHAHGTAAFVCDAIEIYCKK